METIFYRNCELPISFLKEHEFCSIVDDGRRRFPIFGKKPYKPNYVMFERVICSEKCEKILKEKNLW